MKIKRCPECMGVASICYAFKKGKYVAFIQCDICGTKGKEFESNNTADWMLPACSDAINAWNMKRKAD